MRPPIQGAPAGRRGRQGLAGNAHTRATDDPRPCTATGAGKVVLVSSSKLKVAVRLYESLGFRHRPLPDRTAYASADVYMELPISNAGNR